MGIVQNWPDDTVATGWFIPLREGYRVVSHKTWENMTLVFRWFICKGVWAPMENFRKIRRPRPSLRRAWDHRRCGTWLFRRMALKRAVYFLSPQNLPKPPKTLQNPPKAFLAPAGQRTKATSNTFFLAFKAPSIYFYCVQACRLPGFKPFKTLQNPPKPPKTLQRLFWHA